MTRVKFNTSVRAGQPAPTNWYDENICFWTEDDCLRRDPSAEHLSDAWYRIVGERWGLRTEVSRYDGGDCLYTLYEGGWVVCNSFDGDSIYRVVVFS